MCSSFGRNIIGFLKLFVFVRGARNGLRCSQAAQGNVFHFVHYLSSDDVPLPDSEASSLSVLLMALHKPLQKGCWCSFSNSIRNDVPSKFDLV